VRHVGEVDIVEGAFEMTLYGHLSRGSFKSNPRITKSNKNLIQSTSNQPERRNQVQGHCLRLPSQEPQKFNGKCPL
jgi:hypothetical protein